MKDLASIAAKYSTAKRFPCRICELPPKHLEIVRALRKTHRMSIRGIGKAIEGEFGISVGDTTVHKHFTRHEGA